MTLDELHQVLVGSRDGVADLYRLLEAAVVLLEKSLHEREDMIEQMADLHIVIDAALEDRDKARAELAALRGD